MLDATKAALKPEPSTKILELLIERVLYLKKMKEYKLQKGFIALTNQY